MHFRTMGQRVFKGLQIQSYAICYASVCFVFCFSFFRKSIEESTITTTNTLQRNERSRLLVAI